MIAEAFSKVVDWDRRGLPGWTYHNEALLELELTELFLTHWQVAGHVSDVPNNGDYLTFDIGHERTFVVRGSDGTLRAFHNLCRHRGSRVVTAERGHCRNALVCPFHGWVYNLDGTLRGPARPDSYPALDKIQFGLKPVEMEIWMGFIFLRIRPGPQGSVADYLATYAPEFSVRRPETLLAGGLFTSEIPVNWKSVRDVDNEGYHVAMAHPALQDLYGFTYHDILHAAGRRVSKGTFKANAGKRWSVRNYVRLARGPDWLPGEHRTVWVYYGVFPNNVFILTPETVQFYQELPIEVGRSLVRGAIYHFPGEDRQQRLARYLTRRIDRETFAEDMQLSIWSNESMKSSAFDNFHLSDHERGVRMQHDELRALLPVMSLDKPPISQSMAELNEQMRTK